MFALSVYLKKHGSCLTLLSSLHLLLVLCRSSIRCFSEDAISRFPSSRYLRESGATFQSVNQATGKHDGGARFLPLIRSEPGVCAGQHVFQLGAEFVQFAGKPGEAIVELVVCGHGACNNTDSKSFRRS